MDDDTKDYILETLDKAEIFAHEHKGQDLYNFNSDDSNLWLELCEDLDALLGAYEENLEYQVKMRIRAFLSSGWVKPQTIAGQVEMDDKIEQVLDMSDADYQETLQGVLQRDLD